MSFDRLSSLEAQPTTTRRNEDPEFRDDPEFDKMTENLSTQLFTLTSNISRLSNQIALLGTKRDTERVRERVHDLLEETRDGFKDVGEGLKQVQTWEDVNVSPCYRGLRHGVDSASTVRSAADSQINVYLYDSLDKSGPRPSSPKSFVTRWKSSRRYNGEPWRNSVQLELPSKRAPQQKR